MTRRRMRPVIRTAPPGELNIYSVYEYEIDQLAQGTTATLLLNFGLFFSGIFASSLTTLISAPPTNRWAFDFFAILTLISAITSLVTLCLWWRMSTATGTLVVAIKQRMPELPYAIQDAPADPPPAESFGPSNLEQP